MGRWGDLTAIKDKPLSPREIKGLRENELPD